MDYEELLQYLEDKGIDVSQWNSVSKGEFSSDRPEKIQNILEEMKTLLRHQIQQDISKLQDARELLNRLKHGGNTG